jgi:homoserine kinase type II
MSDLDAAAVARTLTQAITTIWPITTPARLTPLGAGQNSLVYRVETSASAPCILRVYRNHADVARVHHELAMLAALAPAPLPFAVPTPLATRAGALVHPLPVEDDILLGTLAVLWTELPGTHPDPADEDQAEAVGVALALLDRALAAIDPATLPGHESATPPLNKLRRRVSAPDDIEDALLQLPLPAQDTAELPRLLRVVEAEVPLLYAHLPQQLVHADVDQSQVLMDGARVTAILDFEFCHVDLRIYDLVVPLDLWPRALFGTGTEWGVLEALGRGYTAHLRLLPAEVQTLPLLLRVRAIGGLLRDIAWHWQGRVSAARVQHRAAWGDHSERNPTDRGKRGVKRSLLVEAMGGPLAIVVAGANVHDTKLLADTLDAVVVARPRAHAGMALEVPCTAHPP